MKLVTCNLLLAWMLLVYPPVTQANINVDQDYELPVITPTPALLAKTGRLTAGTVVTAIVESGIALHSAVNNFTNAEVLPVINDLNDRIRAMNLEDAGIPQEKIPEYEKSLEDFTNIRKELMTMRIVLKSLAMESIRRGNSLLKTMDVAERNPEKTQKALRYAAEKMVKLINRSNEVLADAEKYLSDVNKKLSTIDANLMTLRNKLDKNSSEVILKINLISKRRKKRFVITTAILIGLGVVGVAGATTAVGIGISLANVNKQNALLEQQIKNQKEQIKQLNEKYERALQESQQRYDEMNKMLKDAQMREEKMLQERKNMELKKLDAQKTVINTALESVNHFLGSLKDTENHITHEQTLIREWRANLIEMIDSMKSADDVLDLFDFEPESIRTMVKNLNHACQNYIDGRIPVGYNDIINLQQP